MTDAPAPPYDEREWYARVLDAAREQRLAALGEICPRCVGWIDPIDVMLRPQATMRLCRCPDTGRDSLASLAARHGVAGAVRQLVPDYSARGIYA